MIDPKKEEMNKLIDERIKKIVPNYLEAGAFTQRKLTDTPSDNLQVVNRRYVNLYGTTADRPVASVYGQKYFDTTIGRPIYINPTTGRWVDGAGSIS